MTISSSRKPIPEKPPSGAPPPASPARWRDDLIAAVREWRAAREAQDTYRIFHATSVLYEAATAYEAHANEMPDLA